MENPSERIIKLIEECKDVEDFHENSIEKSLSSFDEWFEDFRNGGTDYQPNLQGMITNNLTEEEAYFILAYTGGASSWINSELRLGEIANSPCKQSYINLLDKSLEKVSQFQNGIVYRMDTPHSEKDKVLNWFGNKIGSTINIPYFLSTAKEDYKSSPIVWEIRTLKQYSCAKDISNLTNNEYELEVLFSRDSRFKITRVDKSSSLVYLTEVSQDSKPDYNLVGRYFENL